MSLIGSEKIDVNVNLHSLSPEIVGRLRTKQLLNFKLSLRIDLIFINILFPRYQPRLVSLDSRQKTVTNRQKDKRCVYAVLNYPVGEGTT